MNETRRVDVVVRSIDAKKDGKLTFALYDINDDGELNELHRYAMNKSLKRFRVGHVYEIDMSEEGTIYTGPNTKWKGEYHDKVKVATWQARYQAEESERKAAAIEKKMSTHYSSLEHPIAQLAETYSRIGNNQRLSFELWLLNRIRVKSRG